MTHDAVDRILAEWRSARPDLDVTPLGVVGRVSRLSRLLDRELSQSFGRFDLENWMYDVLATLRRAGDPYELTAGQLVRHSMVTTGAITNRINRLEERGLVVRSRRRDRRQVVVSLTPAGLAVVEEVVGPHLAYESELLSSLSDAETAQLASLLRKVLVALGDGS